VFQTLNRLSQLEVNNAQAGMHADGGGLYLQVTKTASGQLNKSWLFRFAVGGRERQMELGSATEVKLTDARRKAADCRQQRLEGIDPIEARESARRLAEESAITFRRAFETYFATKRKSLSNAKHAAQWQSTMPLSNHSFAFGEGHDAPCWPTAAEHTMSALGPTTANKMLTPYPANF
jgi:hypothetical protein